MFPHYAVSPMSSGVIMALLSTVPPPAISTGAGRHPQNGLNDCESPIPSHLTPGKAAGLEGKKHSHKTRAFVPALPATHLS